MKRRYFTPLIAFLFPTLVIGYGVVIPGSCVAGINQLSIGFSTTLIGACGAYWLGLRAVITDQHDSYKPTAG